MGNFFSDIADTLSGPVGLLFPATAAISAATTVGNTYSALKPDKPKPAPVQPSVDNSWMAEMMASQEAMMAEQMAMQERFNQQQMALQQQQMDLAREQMLKQEEMAKLSNVEAQKNPSDFPQANALDTRRKQLLRRGLMSTFTRYAQPGASGTAAKADKLGG